MQLSDHYINNISKQCRADKAFWEVLTARGLYKEYVVLNTLQNNANIHCNTQSIVLVLGSRILTIHQPTLNAR